MSLFLKILWSNFNVLFFLWILNWFFYFILVWDCDFGVKTVILNWFEDCNFLFWTFYFSEIVILAWGC
jgi:hypothetical protein